MCESPSNVADPDFNMHVARQSAIVPLWQQLLLSRLCLLQLSPKLHDPKKFRHFAEPSGLCWGANIPLTSAKISVLNISVTVASLATEFYRAPDTRMSPNLFNALLSAVRFLLEFFSLAYQIHTMNHDFYLSRDNPIEPSLIETAAQEVKSSERRPAQGSSYAKLEWTDGCQKILDVSYAKVFRRFFSSNQKTTNLLFR